MGLIEPTGNETCRGRACGFVFLKPERLTYTVQTSMDLYKSKLFTIYCMLDSIPIVWQIKLVIRASVCRSSPMDQ